MGEDLRFFTSGMKDSRKTFDRLTELLFIIGGFFVIAYFYTKTKAHYFRVVFIGIGN